MSNFGLNDAQSALILPGVVSDGIIAPTINTFTHKLVLLAPRMSLR